MTPKQHNAQRGAAAVRLFQSAIPMPSRNSPASQGAKTGWPMRFQVAFASPLTKNMPNVSSEVLARLDIPRELDDTPWVRSRNSCGWRKK